MAEKQKVLVYECISAGGLPAIAGNGAAASRLLSQGVMMRNAMIADLTRLKHVRVACATSSSAPLPRYLAHVRSIDTSRLGAAEFLGCEADEHDRVWVVAPESDGLLGRLAEAVGDARWLGCSRDAIRLAGSKTATRECLGGAGMPIPYSWRPGDPEAGSGRRWVVKPDDGAGGEAAYLHPDFASARQDLLARLERGFASTAEAWIEGVPLSLSLLCADGRAELLSINRQRITVQTGQPVRYCGVEIGTEALDSPTGGILAELAEGIATAMPGLAGYVGVDLVWQPSDGPVVIEINPRLTCAYVGLSASLGRNLAGEILPAPYQEASTHALR